MKRLISILLATMCMTVCCLAAGSGLACEQFFGDEYRILKNVDITIVNDNNNHYHSISVKGDRALVKKIRKAHSCCNVCLLLKERSFNYLDTLRAEKFKKFRT